MELSRNDTYWRGAPRLDKIIRKEFKDPATALIAFDAGEVDYTYLTADEVGASRAMPTRGSSAGPSQVDNMIVLNRVQVPAFANKVFRQAIEYAIDRDSIIKNLYGGQGQPLPCLLGNPATSHRPGEVRLRSRQGQGAPDAGRRRPGVARDIVFDTYYNDPLSLNVMTAIQANWAAVGFKIKIQQMDGAAWTKRHSRRHFPDVVQRRPERRGRRRTSRRPTSSSASQEAGAGHNGWNGYLYTNPQSICCSSRVAVLRPGGPRDHLPAALHGPGRRHAVERHVADDPLLDRQQPDRQLPPHAGAGRWFLLRRRRDLVRQAVTS